MKTYMGEVSKNHGMAIGETWHIYIPDIDEWIDSVKPEQNDALARRMVSVALQVPLDDVQVMLEVVDR